MTAVTASLVLGLAWFANSWIALAFGLAILAIAAAFNRRVRSMTSEAVEIVIAYHKFWNDRH